MERRNFLKLTTLFTFQASLGGLLSGCHSSSSSKPLTPASFPQGVASADPKPKSVVLWTRAKPERTTLETIFLQVEVANDEGFNQIILKEPITASANQDFTVHVRITGLEADQVYYYRFITNNDDRSDTGRTWTAPESASTTTIPLAFVSCQERKHGFYGAYRRMLLDDINKPLHEQIRFVLHLGDFIYETDEAWQTPLDEQLEPITDGLISQQGEPREYGLFPDGNISESGIYHANSLADYRHLYKTYLKDPDLLAARARWPFICIWDDHEFSDDCWQTEANYNDSGATSSTNEPSQRRKVAANQAWSEYIPMDYSQTTEPDSELHHARAFEFADVENTNNDQPNTNNQVAIETLTIYRRLQFGQLLDLILTDNRSYRSDHAVPENLSGNLNAFIHPRGLMPLALLNQMDAGSTANNNQPETFLSIPGNVFLNPRRNSVPGSLLGKRQKQWWKTAMRQSTARWKVWGNSVPLMQLRINLGELHEFLSDSVASADTWDGYAQERNELMQFLVDEQILNMVSLSGDVHAHFAGHVMNDFDAVNQKTAAVEVVTAAISSQSLFEGVERMSRRANPNELEMEIRSLIAYRDPDDSNSLIQNLNNTLLNGVNSGLAAAQGKNSEEVSAVKDPKVNPHLLYANTDGHGYGLANISTSDITIKLVTLKTITNDIESDQVLEVSEFQIPYSNNINDTVIFHS